MRKARVHTLLRYIAANVQSLRAARGLTQLELAERAELDLRHLQRIERAAVNLSIGALIALADSLNVTPASLFEPADLAPPRVGRPKADVDLPVIAPVRMPKRKRTAAAGAVAVSDVTVPIVAAAPLTPEVRARKPRNRHRPTPR